jgi:hypothetical protein
LATFDEWGEEIEEMRHADNKVYVALTQHGRGKGSGGEIEDSYAVIYELESDQIIRMTLYMDRNEALKAAGLQE